MKFTERFPFIKAPYFILCTYITIVVIASVHRYLLGIDHVNNYLIFKFSFSNLLDYKDLYTAHPEYNDLYKYSPTFALLMAPFAILPNLVGLIFWNLINALVLFLAIKKAPLDAEKKVILWTLVLLELLTSVQNSQSNGLMAGLILLSFISFEKRNIFLAAFFISLSFYIKVFGIMGAMLFFLYPDKIKFILYMILWIIVLFVLPLLVIPLKQLTFLYQSWFNLLAHDQGHSLNFSVMTLLRTWFNINIKDVYVQLTGLVLLMLPLLNFKLYKDLQFRILMLSSVLIWIIIFNHKAESPTFVIAMLGIGLWFITEKVSGLTIALLLFAFILTSLSPTDLFPKFVKEQFIVPYVLKVLPCIIIWMRVQYVLLINLRK